MEIGMGQHGEGGGGRCKVLSADETAKIMFGDVSKALKLKTGEKIFVMANGVGATTPMELAIVFRAVKKLAEEIGVYDKVMEGGWRVLSAKESGRIGGILSKRKRAREKQKAQNENAK